MEPLTHLIFGHSAAGSLRQALKRENVYSIVNYWGLNYAGPLDVEPSRRGIWIQETLWSAFEDEDLAQEYTSEIEAALLEISDKSRRVLIWMCFRNAKELAELYSLSSLLSSERTLLCDVERVEQVASDPRFSSSEKITSTGHLHPETLAELFELRRAVSESEVQEWRAIWRQLESDNSELRLLVDGKLKSAPPDYFDQQILQRVSPTAQPASRIVGRCIGEIDKQVEFQQGFDDLFWSSRLFDLEDKGMIVIEGLTDAPLSEIQVRLA